MTEAAPLTDRATFVSHYGGIYEHSAWIAERAFDQGHLPSYLSEPGRSDPIELRCSDEASALAASLAKTLSNSSDPEKLALILAHPDLVGNAALAGELTDESNAEQASAGLDKCSADELARFQSANAAYKERFGFPFIMAVRGADRQSILAAFELRLSNDKQVEFDTALVEINKIALLRLEALIKS